MEVWSTVVVNITAIITGIIVAARWFIQRIEPNVRNVSGSALVSLVVTVVTAILTGVLGKWVEILWAQLFNGR